MLLYPLSLDLSIVSLKIEFVFEYIKRDDLNAISLMDESLSVKCHPSVIILCVITPWGSSVSVKTQRTLR